MHDHQRIAYSLVAELLQKVFEGIVVVPHERLAFGGEHVLEQPRPSKRTDKFINISIMAKSAYEILGWHNMLE